MGWFGRLESCNVPALQDMIPVLPFEPGSTYHQVDLETDMAVEGLANYFFLQTFNNGRDDMPNYFHRHNGTINYFGFLAARQIVEANERVEKLGQPRPYAVYIGYDEFDIPDAYVYARDAEPVATRVVQ